MTAATIHWRCLDCPASGTTTGGEQGADVKHVRAEGHGTTTSLREWLADEGLAGMGAGL